MRTLTIRAVIAAATLVLPGCGGSSGGGTTTPTTTFTLGNTMSTAEAAEAMQVLTLTNQHRANTGGLPPLTHHAGATQAATDHCVYMMQQNNLSHTGPTGLVDPGDRLTAAGVTWTAWRENSAQGQTTPTSVVNAWIASPGHNTNMLATDITQLGVGKITSGGPWWTQKFFRP